MAVKSALGRKRPVVQEIPNEPFRFHVESRSPGVAPYLVDLEEYDWNGWCGCPDFQFHREPLLARGAAPALQLQCWHLLQAGLYFRRKIGSRLAHAMDRNFPTLKKHHAQKTTPTESTLDDRIPEAIGARAPR